MTELASTVGRPTDPSADSARPGDRPTESPARRRRTRPILGALAALVLVAGLFVGGFFVGRGTTPEPTQLGGTPPSGTTQPQLGTPPGETTDGTSDGTSGDATAAWYVVGSAVARI